MPHSITKKSIARGTYAAQGLGAPTQPNIQKGDCARHNLSLRDYWKDPTLSAHLSAKHLRRLLHQALVAMFG